MNLIEPILADAAAITALRRDLHAHPELCYEETRTADVVAKCLADWGIPVHRGLGKTGVVGIVKNGSSTRAVGLRADMDALPMTEHNTFAHASKHAGKMHACGHDGHTAILMSVARILAERRESLAGNVVLAFQPAEERPPGGALGMIADGAMDDPKVDAVFGLHLTGAPVGTVSARGGASASAADSFRATILGVGGHGARPQAAVDPVLIAAHVVTALHSIVSRNVDPLQAAVITVGSIQAGTVPNVIPPTATMSATVRSFDEGVRKRLRERIEETVVGIARAFGGDATVEYSLGYPVLVNDEDMAEFVRSVAHEVVGPEKTIVRPPTMASEDVGYFISRAKGCYFNLGVLNEAKGFTVTNHNPGFDIDEDALPVGVEMLVRIVERYLNG